MDKNSYKAKVVILANCSISFAALVSQVLIAERIENKYRVVHLSFPEVGTDREIIHDFSYCLGLLLLDDEHTERKNEFVRQLKQDYSVIPVPHNKETTEIEKRVLELAKQRAKQKVENDII